MTDLDARYGRRATRSPRRRTALAILGVSVAVAAVTGFYLWWAAAQDPFAASIQAFSVESDTLVSATAAVTSDGEQVVRCELLAKDRSTQPVGTAIVELPKGQREAALSTTITTTGRAVTVVVRDCATVSARVP
jgi:hypothetical protein